jgi:DNA-binding MarR family transcriptional regulator
MSASRQVTHNLNELVEVFMHRSMQAAVRFAREHDLSMGQMSTLMRLHHGSACGVTDIGAQLGVTSAAASQMIDRLAHMGLVERTEDPNDRRVKQLKLTDKGRDLLHKSQTARSRWMESLVDALDPERRAAVIAALGYLTEAAKRLETDVKYE